MKESIVFKLESISDRLQELDALLADLLKAKPSSAKGVYLQKVTVSTTMGPGLIVDKATLSV